MRRLVATFVVGTFAILAVGTQPAEAQMAPPRPLERKVADADLVVVAKVRTQAEHSGDVFEADVEKTLKGDAGTGPLRVSAACYFQGCIVTDAMPPAPAHERQGERYVLFLDAAKEGARASRDPMSLAPAARTSSRWWDPRLASTAPAVIEALVLLDAEQDAARGAVRWAEGLEGDNLLLASCLLYRVQFSGGKEDGDLGGRVVDLAAKQLAAGRARLVAAVARHAEGDDMYARTYAFQAAMTLHPAVSDAERPAFDRITAAARTGAAKNDDGRYDAAAWLCRAADSQAVPFLVWLLRRDGAKHAGDLARYAKDLVAHDPARRAELAAAILPLLGDDIQRAAAVQFVRSFSGRNFADAEACRTWLRPR